MKPSIKKNLLLFLTVLIVVSSAVEANSIPSALHRVLEQSQGLMAQGEFAKAAAVLTDFRTKNKTQHHLLDYIHGNALLGSDHPRKAQIYFQNAIAQKPDFLPAHQNLARCYYELGNMTKAAKAFENAYTLSDGAKPEFLFYAANSLAALGNAQDSLALYTRLMDEHGKNAKLEWKEGMVQTMLSAGKIREAIPFIEEIVGQANGGRKRQWQEVLLFQYAELGMVSKALVYVKGLLDQAPAEAIWWRSLWRLHLMEGDYQEALAALISYSHISPLNDEEIKLVADLYAVSGVPAKAVDFYQHALETHQDPELILKLVRNFRRMRKPEQALEWINKAMAEGGSQKMFALPKAYALYDMKEYSKAASTFEQAASVSNNPGQAWLMAAYAAWNVQDKDLARKYLKKAAKYKYSKKAASRMLKKI